MSSRASFLGLQRIFKVPDFAVLVIFPLFAFAPVLCAEGATPAPINDLRVIVDISGSMKKTDPTNLRRPAIRLLAGLIPAGSRAGIWNFGQQVNMTVKVGKVDAAWRKLAREQSKKINSAGLYTDIESAIRKASFDWKTPDPRYNRNLIILTDGHVDISKDAKKNKQSRARILKQLIPILEKAKVRVHTIALSDDVDEILLSTLSHYTNGLYKKVKHADDLQKIFLQMLEQAVKLDSLPLENNSFNVDASINDMTLLVFNKDEHKLTLLLDPDGKSWGAEMHKTNVNWFHDEGFDLITIKKPQQGKWKIIAPVDRNNRVIVVTNLKLYVKDLPVMLMFGDVLKIEAQLHEDGKPLADQRLLSKFKFILKTTKGQTEREFPMFKSDTDNTIFDIQLPPIFKEGDIELVVQAKSPTVEREIHHQLTVYSTPAEIIISAKPPGMLVTVTPLANLLRPESVKMIIELEDENKFIMAQHGNSWLFEADIKYKNTMVNISLEAKRADGKILTANFTKRLEVNELPQALSLEVKKEVEHIKIITAKPPKEKNVSKEHEKEKIKAKPEKEEINWTLIIISIVVGNILIIGTFVGGYIFIKRRKAKLAESLKDDMMEGMEDPSGGEKK